MNLRENIKKELRLISEQNPWPWQMDHSGLRMCKCKDAINNSCEDFWSGGGNPGPYSLNGDYFYSTWMKKHYVEGGVPQVGDIVKINNEPFIIDMVNDGTPGADFQGPGLPGGPNNYPAMIDCQCCNSTGNQNCAGGYNFNLWTGPMTPNHAAGCSSYNPCTIMGCTDPTALNYNSAAAAGGSQCDDGSCIFTPPCDTTPGSPCAQQWFQNPNASWASNWINNRDCTNYTWPATNLETQALSLMASAPNPQPNVYNDYNDIWNAGNTAWPNTTGAPKTQFIGKMAKAKYSQCQKQACSC